MVGWRPPPSSRCPVPPGLAVGMAPERHPQNFAGGVTILVFKPYKVGDFIEAQGHKAVRVNSIRDLQHRASRPRTTRRVILPNAPVSTGALVNYGTEARRRVDLGLRDGWR